MCCFLSGNAGYGHLDVVIYLKEGYGLTREDAEKTNCLQLCEINELECTRVDSVLEYLREGFGLKSRMNRDTFFEYVLEHLQQQQ